MPQTQVPSNMVSISETAIVFGKGVSNFFDRYHINNVLVIMNHNNDSIIIKGVQEDYGIKIQRDRWNYFVITRILKYIDFSNLGNYQLARQAYRTLAVPLSKTSILLENVKLKKNPLAIGNKLYIDINSKLIIVANFSRKQKIDLNIPLSELVRQPKSVPVSPTAKSNGTVTPFQPKPVRTATPSLPEPAKKHIPDKENANIDLLEIPAENSASSDDIERANKEYSKMILGE